jgi:DoxX-like family
VTLKLCGNDKNQKTKGQHGRKEVMSESAVAGREGGKLMTQGVEAPLSKGNIWAGRILSAIPVLVLFLAGTMKLTKAAAIMDGLGHSGYSERLVVPIGILEISCAIIYLIPRTSVIGAVLLTGFLGGATATCVRVADPSFFLPVALGMMAWAGLYLRDSRLHHLIPWNKY